MLLAFTRRPIFDLKRFTAAEEADYLVPFFSGEAINGVINFELNSLSACQSFLENFFADVLLFKWRRDSLLVDEVAISEESYAIFEANVSRIITSRNDNDWPRVPTMRTWFENFLQDRLLSICFVNCWDFCKPQSRFENVDVALSQNWIGGCSLLFESLSFLKGLDHLLNSFNFLLLITKCDFLVAKVEHFQKVKGLTAQHGISVWQFDFSSI